MTTTLDFVKNCEHLGTMGCVVLDAGHSAEVWRHYTGRQGKVCMCLVMTSRVDLPKCWQLQQCRVDVKNSMFLKSSLTLVYFFVCCATSTKLCNFIALWLAPCYDTEWIAILLLLLLLLLLSDHGCHFVFFSTFCDCTTHICSTEEHTTFARVLGIILIFAY